MITAYVYDSGLKVKVNNEKKNYWYEYVKEIFDQMGLRAKEISRHHLEDENCLSDFEVLIIGDLTAEEITDSARETLGKWVQRGGILIGFACEGLDNIFGNTFFSKTYQIDDYTISGYFDLKASPITEGVHSPLAPQQRLLIFSDIRNIKPESSLEHGHLYGIQGVDHGFSAVTERKFGSGYAYYFAFNVPKTVWVLHQGRPVVKDIDGDGRCTTRDLSVIGTNSTKVLYADELLFLIQNMVGRKKQPFIYHIPPEGEEIPDVLFYWGGDDEARNNQVEASNWMKSMDLPYHVNLLHPNFNLSIGQAEEILRNGHEISLHYNFVDEKFRVIPEKFSQENVRIQVSAFKEKYGITPICTVNHGTPWLYWEEAPIWMAEEGGGADNSFLSPLHANGDPGPNFGFGTSYPFYFYRDFRGRNARLNFIEEPINCYEIGYDKERIYPETLSVVVEITAKYHLLMNMFYHSYRIAEWPTCRESIKELLNIIVRKKVKAVHMGNNEVHGWWTARSRARVNDILITSNQIGFKAECDYKAGMIVKIPLEGDYAEKVLYDEEQTIHENRFEFGQNWVYLKSPPGSHKITVNLRKSEKA